MLSKLAGPLMEAVILSTKNILAPLGITVATSTIDVGILKKLYGSGNTTLIISNDEMNDIIKIIQALENPNILLKGVTKTIKNEIKKQKALFLTMLSGTLGASLLGNSLTGKGILRTGSGNKKVKGIARAGSGKKIGFLMLPHPLTNFEIQNYYKNEPRFNDVFLKNNLFKRIKDGANIINLDKYAYVGRLF